MNIRKQSNYSLFKNILITKGFNRNLLFDFQRENIFFVPDSLIEIISKEIFNFNDVVSEFCKDESENRIVEEYFQFLIENEMIFEINENLVGRFPNISENFEEPNFISNMVIDIDLLDQINLENLFIQMEKLLCSNLEIRFYSNISKNQLEDTLINVGNYLINNLFLTLPYNKLFSNEYIDEILERFRFIQYIHFYSSEKNSIEINKNSATQIIHNTKSFSPEKECGQICQNLFNLSKKHYFESLNNNTCLNKKISVDIHGNIKNCPSMKETFGNINNTSLEEALQNNNLKNVWGIKKDDILICKDCEFRNICTDCRAFIENPDNIYSKPLKCGYNPYSNKWEEWSMNPLKQKAIQYYKLK